MAINTLIGAAIGITILAIVVFQVAIPQIKNAMESSNLTTTERQLANLTPLFMILGMFVIVVAVFVLRWIV